MKHQVVLCTCPDTEAAETIANILVDQGLAACVNIIPGLRSVYRWQGRREQAEELLLVIKSRVESYPRIEENILQLHPYELPEIIAIPIIAGLPAYLAWIEGKGDV